MCSYVTAMAVPAAGSVHGCLLTARGAVPAPAGGRRIAIAALISWLIAEGLGAYMLSRWIAGGGARRPRAEPGGVPRWVIFGHAGLAFIGFVGWLSFLTAGSAALAWLAICFLTPAIGLGISIVTVWTPYPGRRAGARPPAAPEGDAPSKRGPGQEGPGQQGPGQEQARDGPGGQGSDSGAPPAGHAHSHDGPAGAGPSEMLAHALSDEALTSRLVDDMLASMLAAPASARRPRWRLAPVIPAAHGVAALATFLFAILAAVAAT